MAARPLEAEQAAKSGHQTSGALLLAAEDDLGLSTWGAPAAVTHAQPTSWVSLTISDQLDMHAPQDPLEPPQHLRPPRC